MKAGIYKRRDNGKHIYVAKDRSIRAHQLTDCHPLDAGVRKVNCQQKEQVVSWPEHSTDMQNIVTVYADRVADVPNGVTDHDAALQQYIAYADLKNAMTKPPFVDFREAGRVHRKGQEPVTRVEIPAPTEEDVQKMLSGKGERVVGMPRELGMGYGPDALLASAQTIRETNAGVPPHVAQKIVSSWREGQPEMVPSEQLVQTTARNIAREEAHGSFVNVDFAEVELRATAMIAKTVDQVKTEREKVAKKLLADTLRLEEGSDDWNSLESDVVSGRYEVVTACDPGTSEIIDRSTGERYPLFAEAVRAFYQWKPRFSDEFMQSMVQSANAAQADDEMENYLAIAEERGIITRLQDEIVIHDEHRYKAFMDRVLKRNPKIAENEIAARTNGPSIEDWWVNKIRAGEIRLIGKQSKRKHRKAGHRVFWCGPLASWAWEVRA